MEASQLPNKNSLGFQVLDSHYARLGTLGIVVIVTLLAKDHHQEHVGLGFHGAVVSLLWLTLFLLFSIMVMEECLRNLGNGGFRRQAS